MAQYTWNRNVDNTPGPAFLLKIMLSSGRTAPLRIDGGLGPRVMQLLGRVTGSKVVSRLDWASPSLPKSCLLIPAWQSVRGDHAVTSLCLCDRPGKLLIALPPPPAHVAQGHAQPSFSSFLGLPCIRDLQAVAGAWRQKRHATALSRVDLCTLLTQNPWDERTPDTGEPPDHSAV
jgi:hypothetical protein